MQLIFVAPRRGNRPTWPGASALPHQWRLPCGVQVIVPASLRRRARNRRRRSGRAPVVGRAWGHSRRDEVKAFGGFVEIGHDSSPNDDAGFSVLRELGKNTEEVQTPLPAQAKWSCATMRAVENFSHTKNVFSQCGIVDPMKKGKVDRI